MDSIPETNGSSPQLLLESFIPGYSIIRAFFMIFHIDITKYVAGIAIVLGALAGFRYLYSMLGDSFLSYFLTSAEISPEDEMYNFFMAWLAQQPSSQNARQFVASVSTNSNWIWRPQYDQEEEDEPDAADLSLYAEDSPEYWRNITKGKVAPLYYTPGLGTSFFWYKRRLLILSRNEDRTNSFLRTSPRYSVFISCVGWSPLILKELLDEVRQSFFTKDLEKTVIYRGGTVNSTPTWTRCMAREIRPLDTVIIGESEKESLISDMKEYLHPSTRRFYANRGIPYRRGYLLHGPPGTGKSSLSFALAGIFGLQLYIINLNSRIDEQDLARLFESLPPQCLVLLEDIDTAGIDKRPDTEKAEASPLPEALTKVVAADTKTPKISLSALLNVIDGVASHEGRVLIMTTNHVDKLDEALIRPGRIDKTIEFKYADESAVSSLFRGMYAVDAEKPTKVVEKPSMYTANHTLSPTEIIALAKNLATIIPKDEFSPAEIQGFLLKHKRDPKQALTDCPAWIEETRLKKKKAQEAKEKEEKESKKKTKKLHKLLHPEWKKLRALHKLLKS